MASVDCPCPFWASFHCAFSMEQNTCDMCFLKRQVLPLNLRRCHSGSEGWTERLDISTKGLVQLSFTEEMHDSIFCFFFNTWECSCQTSCTETRCWARELPLAFYSLERMKCCWRQIHRLKVPRPCTSCWTGRRICALFCSHTLPDLADTCCPFFRNLCCNDWSHSHSRKACMFPESSLGSLVSWRSSASYSPPLSTLKESDMASVKQCGCLDPTRIA